MLFRSDRKSTRLNSSHLVISYAVFCLKKKKNKSTRMQQHDRTAHSAGCARPRPRSTAPIRRLPMPSKSGLPPCLFFFFFFFFNDTATTEIYTLSLHDALPIYQEIDEHLPRQRGCQLLPQL